MKISIDTDKKTLHIAGQNSERTVDLYSKESFESLSDLWVTVGWHQKYPYTFSWMGRPVIQLPEDMVRTQEVIYKLKPDVIVETGIAHGGSLIYYASLCKAMGRGRVIGVDIEIRPPNRKAMEAHELYSYITMIEGSSVDEQIVGQVASLIKKGEKVLVILDSNHSKKHVLRELELFSPLVTPGSYLVATDGVMGQVAHGPRGISNWTEDNPTQAALEFARGHADFVIEQPAWPFNESDLNKNVTHWPGAWLRKK